MQPPLVLIVNPAAGRGAAGKHAREINEKLRQYGIRDPVWLYTRMPGDAEAFGRQAAERGTPLVGVVGGDGTVHEVVNGIAGSKTALGLIPIGTGNDFARALGLHGDLDAACRILAQGNTRPVDLGRIEGPGTGGVRRFIAIAGAGFDACTAQAVNSGIRFLTGPGAYVCGAILTARHFRPFQLSLTSDGETHRTEAMFVSIANTSTTGGGMKIAPDARIDDGWLDICLVGAVHNAELLWQMTNVFRGAHVNHRAVTMLRARTVKLSAEPPQPLLVDGEVCGTTPATIVLDRHAVMVKAPA